MPELPEVETVRKGLELLILNKKISKVEAFWKGAVKTNYQKFATILVGNKIRNIQRVGKLLIFELKLGGNLYYEFLWRLFLS